MIRKFQCPKRIMYFLIKPDDYFIKQFTSAYVLKHTLFYVLIKLVVL